LLRLNADNPGNVLLDVDQRLFRRNRQLGELIEELFPTLAERFPSDNQVSAGRIDGDDVVVVGPDVFHGVDVARGHSSVEGKTRGSDGVDLRLLVCSRTSNCHEEHASGGD
jgi:hypothetical protein